MRKFFFELCCGLSHRLDSLRVSSVPGHKPKAGEENRTPVKLDLGKYERAVFRCYLDVQNHADGDLKYKILTPTNTVTYRARNMVSENPISGAVTEAVTFDVTTAGSPEVVANGGTGPLYAFIEGTITAGDTAGNVDLQAAQNASNANATVVKFGTYLEYLKF